MVLLFLVRQFLFFLVSWFLCFGSVGFNFLVSWFFCSWLVGRSFGRLVGCYFFALSVLMLQGSCVINSV